jgi:Rrf2 family nitric oxide-sensitive transcriptional repressor
MQLNAFTDYALRVLVYAAVHDQRRCTCEEIADAFGISRHHIVKVINGLRHLGYLHTHRGRQGGFGLALPPARIVLGEVVRRTEGTLTVVECFDGRTNTCPLTHACGLKGVLAEALDAFCAVLDRYTVADLVAEPKWIRRLTAIGVRRRPADPATDRRADTGRLRPQLLSISRPSSGR